MKKNFPNDTFVGLALALAVFVMYLATLSRSVQPEDCGELAAALYTLGIAHPTGYPTLTLLGWAFSHLPLGGRVIERLNVLMALQCAAAAYLFYRLFVFLMSKRARALFSARMPPSGQTEAPASPARFIRDRVAAASAVLILAFSQTVWSEAVSMEVYAFHLLFLSAVTLLFLRALSEHVAGSAAAWRWWIGFSLVLGLSFTNHMMTVLLAPAFLYLFFAVHGFGRTAWLKIAQAVPPFLIGLTPYLYLPLRAAQHPLVNWGDPSTPGNLWQHVSGGQFHYAMFSSTEVPLAKLIAFFRDFPAEFGYTPLFLMAVGLWALGRGNRRLLVFSVLLFLGCLFYSLNYEFNDLNYYVNAYLAAAIWVCAGVGAILGGMRRRNLVVPGAAFCAALALFPAGLNYSVSDRSRDFGCEDYARNVLNSLAPNALLFTDQYDCLAAPSEYLQNVEGLRPDVVVVDNALLAIPWYFRLLQDQHPELLQEAHGEMEALSVEYASYMDRGALTDRDTVALKNRTAPVWDRTAALARRVIEEALSRRPVYVTAETWSEYYRGYSSVPDGMALRLFEGSVPPPLNPIHVSWRPFVRSDPPMVAVQGYYAVAFVDQGIYSFMRGDMAGAAALFQKALSAAPGNPLALEWLGRVNGAH